MLGLGSNISKTGKLGVHDLGIVTSDLVLKHNYDLSSVQPLSDGAAFFDGDDDYVELGSQSGDLRLSGSNGSVTAWINPTLTGDEYKRIVDKSDGGNGANGYALFVKNDGTVQGNINGVAQVATSSGVVVTSEWQHLVWTWDGTTHYIYVNGIEVQSGSSSTTPPSDTMNMRIGTWNHSTEREYKGYMCNVGIFEEALTQPQIKSIMNKNYAGLTSSEKEDLVSWWNLDSVIDSADLGDGDTTVYDNHHGGGEVLGSETTPASDFSSSDFETNPSAGSVSEDNGTLIFDNSSSTGVQVQLKNRDISSDKTYKIVFTLSDFTSGTFKMSVGNNITTVINYNDVGAEGTHTFYVTKTGGQNRNYFYTGSTSVVVSNISVKLVNGNTGTLS